MVISRKEPKPRTLMRQFLVGAEEHCTFRFCGKEFRQDENFGTHVTAKDNTERVQPITDDAKQALTRKTTADEIHQLRSVTQSLAWIARQTRPDLSYRISKSQSTSENAYVRDLRERNRSVENATSKSTRGIYFLQNFLGMMRLSRRSVTPVSVKTRNDSTESLRTSNHNKLVSHLWHLVTC